MVRRLLLILIAQAIALTAVAVADNTKAVGSTLHPWPYPAVCANGELTGQVSLTPRAIEIRFAGWIQPCPDQDTALRSQARWGLAYYFGQLDYGVAAPMLFPSTGERADFTATMQKIRGPLLMLPRTVCLISGNGASVACLAIGPMSDTDPPTITPIPPPDGTRVVLPTPDSTPLSGPRPECIACV